MYDASAVTISNGRYLLAIGTEVGITALQIATVGDQTVIDLADLGGTAQRLTSIANTPNSPDLVFIVADKSDRESNAAPNELAIRTYGPDDAPITVAVGKLAVAVRKGLLAEAAFASWRQRLADASECLQPITSDDAKIIGRLDLPGGPLLTELRADRRRAVNAHANYARTAQGKNDVVEGVVADLYAAVRFGAAGLADTTDELLDESIRLACERGGWRDRLRLLLAAEEVSAIEHLTVVGAQLASNATTAIAEAIFDQLLAKYESRRRHTEELCALLREAMNRIPTTPSNPVTRLFRGKEQSEAQILQRTISAYLTVVAAASTPDRAATTWDDAARSLVTIDDAASLELADRSRHSDKESSASADDVATALGALFAARLPAAEEILDGLKEQHRDADIEALVSIVKRRAVRKLAAASRYPDAGESIQHIVAELAMCIALLRGIKPGTDAEFHDLGERILARANKIADLQAQAGNALPHAVAGLNRLVSLIQPVLTEIAFRQMGVLKPQGPGMARNAYKAARSKVWRARYDKNVTTAAAGGGATALLKAVDAAAPRLIVRYVDQSLPVPKRE